MTWLSKSELLASDQGLQKLKENFWSPAAIRNRTLICLLAAFVTFSTVTGLLYLINVQSPAIKWPIAMGFMFVGFMVPFCYFTCFRQRQVVKKAFDDLATSFQKDVSNLLKIESDLRTLDSAQRLLVLVDAVNITRNLFIRTYEVGNKCQNKNARISKVLLKVFKSLNDLVIATNLNLSQLINDTKRTLNAPEHYKFQPDGEIDAGDSFGQKQLMAVDLIFRLYLPLYALLKQTAKYDDL